MTTGKDGSGIIVVASFFVINVFVIKVSFFIICIVPFSVNIHRDGTLDRLIRSSHHAIEAFCGRLTAASTDNGIVTRLDSDAESLFAMRHRIFEGFDQFWCIQRLVSAIVVEATENMKWGGNGSVDATISKIVNTEACHLDAITHFQVVILAIDNLIGITAIVVEGDMFKAGISPDRQTFCRTRDFYLPFIVFVPFSRDGSITEKFRMVFLGFFPLNSSQQIFS